MTITRHLAARKTRGIERTLRVCLDEPKVARPEWCWRDDWVQGGESVYSLLGQFQVLNAVGGKQVRAAFVDAPRPASFDRLLAPSVDLHDVKHFKLASFAAAVRLSFDVIRLSFVNEAFPTSGWRSYPNLRWCPECAKSGYHAPMFQLPMIHDCPAHGRALEHRCPRCRSNLPYRLLTAVRAPLFCCPVCKHDLAAPLREGVRKGLATADIETLNHQAALLRFCDGLPTVVARAVENVRSTNSVDVRVSSPNARVSEEEFRSFVVRVLASLETRSQMDWNQCEPSYTYIEGHAFSAKARGSQATLPAAGWPDHLVSPSDPGLCRAAALYRCVRRHLWRTVVRPHHRCVWAACERMWWPIVGSQTPPFCPVAAAFLRWRLRWESVIRLSDFLSTPSGPPLGLVAWMASAPIGAASFSGVVQAWLIEHVLGCDLMNVFDATLDEELRRGASEPINWAREWIDGAGDSCWVSVGRGSKSQPIRLFMFPRADTIRQSNMSDGAGHYARQLAIISEIAR